MSIVRTLTGAAVPPQDLVRRFKQVDDRLDVKFIHYPHVNYGNTNVQEYWAIIIRWPDDDPRRQLIQRGDLPEHGDFDVISFLPLDCSVEQAFSFFENACRGQVRDRQDVRRFLERLHKFNENVQEEAMKPVTELAEELIETNAPTLFRNEGKTTSKVVMRGGK